MFLDARLWQFTAGVRGRIAYAVAVGVLAASVGVVRLAMLGWLLGMLYQGASPAELAGPAVLVAVTMLARGALEVIRTRIAHETAARVQLALRERLFDQIVHLGPAHFGVARTGDTLLAVVEGVEQLEKYFGEYLPQLFVAAITPAVIFVALAVLDLPLAAIMLTFAWFTMLAPALFHKWDSASSMRRRDAYKGFAAEFLDSIQGLATLKAFGQAGSRGELLAAKAHEVFRSTMWVLATNSLTRGITDTGITLGAATVLAVGAWRVQEGALELPVLLLVLLAGVEVFRPQRDLRTLLHDGMIGLSAAQGIFEILDARPALTWVSRGARPRDASVRFEDVHFSYPEAGDGEGPRRNAAHVGLDFHVQGGQRFGFVGASGAGKSTVVKLLLRFHDPDSGRIRIGDVDLTAMDASTLYEQVAVVSQDTYLFHGTVAENLRHGNPQASDAELAEAARAANAHEFITTLPQGYDTIIGERGIRLSGGQRQRVAIARALLRDAPILVLDEALSAVDAENESVIQEALDRLMVNRTTLVFAHRLSSVIGCDRILVLDQGRVVEQGSHQELLALGGAYHRLMAAQVHARGADSPEAERLDDAPVSSPTPEPVAGPAEASAILSAEGLGWRGTLRELWSYARPYGGKLGLTFVFGVARVLAFIGVGVSSALVVASLKQGVPYGHWLSLLFILAPAAGILHWLESWIAHDMAFRMLAEMRIALFRKLSALAPAFLVRRRSGDLVAIATHDVELVEYFFAHTIAPAFVALLVPSAVLLVLGQHGWPLALVLTPFLLIVGASPLLLRARIDALGSRARESLAELNAHVVDSVQGLHEIVAFARVDARRAAFLDRVRAHLDIRRPFFRSLTWQNAALEVATGLGGLAIVLTGASLSARGELDATLLPVLTLLALASFLPVSEIAHVGRQLADTLGASRRIHAIQSHPVPVLDGPGVEPAADLGGAALEMRDVVLTYEGQPRPALDGVSLSVEPGHTVAIVGPSGAGKTTVAHLFLRFWDPDSGGVRLLGHDVRDYRLNALRRNIALVSQDTYLFNDSLRSNILMARPDADESALAEAVERAALGDFVASLPQGLDTPVGERGLRLSGGQRQRVSIARAFLKDAPILILDEATSHLDVVSEAAVRDSLATLMHDRTTVVIAHRLATVRDADRIVVLGGGQVRETGSHDELLARNGLYARLVAHQLSGAAA